MPFAERNGHIHDNPATAQWIINSKDAIAGALVKAITSTLGITKKSGSMPAPAPAAPTGPKTLYRVQVGAYSVKANADAMLAKLKAAGFSDAFIKAD